MTTFLLDQNVNKKSLAESCNREGLVVVRRFPRQWQRFPGGFKDPELLPIVMAGQEPLLTNDRNIARDHCSYIPALNPGIIIISLCKGTIKPLGKGDIERIIRKFKQLFSQWHTVKWNNSIVEVTQLGVEVWHIEVGTLRRDAYAAFNDPDWVSAISVALSKNAARRQPALPSQPEQRKLPHSSDDSSSSNSHE